MKMKKYTSVDGLKVVFNKKSNVWELKLNDKVLTTFNTKHTLLSIKDNIENQFKKLGYYYYY